MWVMKLAGLPDGRPTGTGFDGQYLKSFDFEAFDGQGNADFTPELSEALKFETMGDALNFRQTRPVTRPLRRDGLPNRPLTATNWDFIKIEEEVANA